MKNMKIVGALFCFLLVLVGCVKDNSNTNFNTLNSIKISGIDDSYTAELGKMFKITPTVELSDNDVSYTWYIYSTLSNSQRDTISTEKDLEVTFTGDMTIPGVEYTLAFQVKDNKTGVYNSINKPLIVETIYTSGLMMLCEDGGQRELNMLKDGNVLLENIFELNNGAKLDNSINEVAFADPNRLRPEMKHVLLLGKNANGGYVLDPISMAIDKPVREMFDDVIDSDILDVKNYSGKAGNIEYIVVNGRLHKRTTNMGIIPFQGAPMVPFGGKPGHRTNGLLGIVHEPLIFDDLNGRILSHTPWSKGSLIPANPNVSSMTHFDLNNMGNLDMVASGRNNGAGYWIIGRDRDTNVSSLFKFNFTTQGPVRKYTTIDKVKMIPQFSSNYETGFSFVSNMWVFNICFFINDNKLYAINTESISSSGAPNNAEILIKDFGAENLTVTGMVFPTILVPKEDDPTKTRNSYQLRLFVQDESLTSKKGGVIMYEVTTSSGINIKEINRYIGGFCDKIVDIEEKYN